MKKTKFQAVASRFTNQIRISLLLLSAISFFAQEAAAGDQWPAFQGVGASELHADQLPLEWTPNTNVAWRTKLTGAGQSSPVIHGDKVFVTSIDGKMKNDCHVTAISLGNGDTLWNHHAAASQPMRSNYFQSRSAPTPVVDHERVYAFFETGNLVALTHAGEVAWQRSLTEDYGEFEVRIGLAASLTQTANSVFVLVDHEGPSYLLSVDKKTGKTNWQTERFSRQSYASPAILSIAGKPQIVCSSSGSVDGYDPETGKQLWTFEGVGGNRATTPRSVGDGCFLIGASPGMHNERIGDARKSNLAMRVESRNQGFETRVLWKTAQAMPSFGSPMVHQGLAYWVTNVGVVYCFDAETGKKEYVKRATQNCWATPLGVGNRIYLFGKDGLTTVIRAGRGFEVLAKNELFEGAVEAGEADVRRREERNRQNEEREENEKNATEAGGGGRSSDGERPTTRDGLTFAESVQYGYAAVNGSLVIRTGSVVFCLRDSDDANAKDEGDDQ